MSRLLTGSVMLAVLIGVSGTSARVVHQPVTFWNDVTATAVTAGRPGPPGLLDIALVHLAIHDAVQAIERRYEPYMFAGASATGSPEAAVAAAAYGVLSALYPAQRPGPTGLDAIYLDYVATNGLAGDPGLVVGEDAATVLLGQYRPTLALPPNNGALEIGQWRPTPPAHLSGQFEFLAYTEPFALLSSSQFRPQPPPPLTSGTYLRDYDEVKAYGSVDSAVRTAEQTDMAHFWSENFITQWNRALRGIVDSSMSDVGDSARLFALASVASADAAITVWESKSHFNFWRPITAIREGDSDPHPKTIGDRGWTPLVVTPPYSDYTSGANGLTAAYTKVLEMVFGTDEHEFVVTSVAPLAMQKTRFYSRFSEALDEVVDARILLGIHFRFADDAGRRQGARVAHWTVQQLLRPVPGGRAR